MKEQIAKIIFLKCQEHGVEEIWIVEKWDDLAKETKAIYYDIAEVVLNNLNSEVALEGR